MKLEQILTSILLQIQSMLYLFHFNFVQLVH